MYVCIYIFTLGQLPYVLNQTLTGSSSFCVTVEHHSGKMFLVPYRYVFFWVGRLHKNGMIVILLGISSYLLQQKRIHRGGWELSHIPAETRLVGLMFSRSQEGSQLVQVRE